MTYITENIIAMGFPAGDMSSGFFGYVEVRELIETDCFCKKWTFVELFFYQILFNP